MNIIIDPEAAVIVHPTTGEKRTISVGSELAVLTPGTKITVVDSATVLEIEIEERTTFRRIHRSELHGHASTDFLRFVPFNR